jgi:hypothetical protein
LTRIAVTKIQEFNIRECHMMTCGMLLPPPKPTEPTSHVIQRRPHVTRHKPPHTPRSQQRSG